MFGAGVIGSVYAGRLHDAGHDVTLFARGDRLAALRDHGLVLEDAHTGRRTVRRLPLLPTLNEAISFDAIVVAVRREQFADLPAVVAREPPQGSPRQSADLTRTPGPRCSRCSAWWGSGASGQCGPVAAEGEHRQGDERFGGVEAERDAGQHPDLGVGGFDQPLR